MSGSQIVANVQSVVEPIIEGLGLELVQVTYGTENGRWILRLLIDGPNGIGHQECQRVSEAVDEPLDAADPIPGAYYLEVSSPGLDRPLTKPQDYVRFAGSKVQLKTAVPIDGRRNWQAQLIGLENDEVILALEGDTQARIPLEHVSRARLVPEL